MVTGMLRPDSGTVRILGKTFDEGGRALRKLLGIVPPVSPEVDAAKSESVFKEAAAIGIASAAVPSGEIADEPGSASARTSPMAAWASSTAPLASMAGSSLRTRPP